MSQGLQGAPVKGALLGLTAAALFGLSTPFAKLLLPSMGPLILAALLYLGGGLGLVGFSAIRRLDGSARARRSPIPCGCSRRLRRRAC